MSSLVIHHLTTGDNRRSFLEVYRVLKSSGELHLVDFGAPRTLLMRIITAVTSRLEETSDNFSGLLSGMMIEAGFDVVETERVSTLFGPLAMIRAQKIRG